ncbi:hypothetical protein D047_2746B, partial [Vibrio parahaemolyticus VPTS-2010_2]
HGS